MYLSRLILNPRSRRVQSEVANPYQMHRSLMRSFPDNLSPDDERVLFRLDNHPRTGILTLLVQSWNPPDWTWLNAPGALGYLLSVSECNPDTKRFGVQFWPGQLLAFRLRANPTVKRSFDNDGHKRVGIYGEEGQTEWLRRKGTQSGFSLLSVRISDEGIVNGHVDRQEKRHALHLLAVQFDGVLRVDDASRFSETVRQGIGSGKGLGFGLLSLAPPVA